MADDDTKKMCVGGDGEEETRDGVAGRKEKERDRSGQDGVGGRGHLVVRD